MQLIRHLSQYIADRPVALAIGNFDGLHRGHRAVLARMQAIAREDGLATAVLTFEPHPRQFFAPGSPPFRLQSRRDKWAGLTELGVEKLFALKFNAGFAGQSAEDFLERVLRQSMKAMAVITGENFSYGKGRSGDIAQLKAWGVQHGIRTEQLAPVIAQGDVCSSTAVRAAIEVGDMHHAAALLGRPYRLSGRVQHGAKEGAKLGYPTANIAPQAGLKLPRLGIYAVRVQHAGGMHDGVASLGVRPTLNPLPKPLLEVHLFDFAGDLYGKRLQVELHQHLRDEKHFDSIDALKAQMGEDAQLARAFLSTCHPVE
jgi:riboflavin kinase/FMN adenylyltransferase